MKLHIGLLFSLLLVSLSTQGYAAKQELHKHDGIYKADSKSGYTNSKRDEDSSADKRRFQDQLKELSKGPDENRKLVHLSRNDESAELGYKDDDEDGKNDKRVNTVPVPATAWLFGSALFGLVGIRRKLF